MRFRLKFFFTILLSSIIGASIITSLLFFNWKIIFKLFFFVYLLSFNIQKVRKELTRNGKILALNDPLRIRTIQESFNGFRDIVINGTQNIYYNLFDRYNSIIKLKNAKSQFYILSPKFLIEGIALLILASAGCFLTITDYENANFIPYWFFCLFFTKIITFNSTDLRSMGILKSEVSINKRCP